MKKQIFGYMKRQVFRSFFGLLLTVALLLTPSAARAQDPQEALSARPDEKSVYMAFGMNDLGGMLRSIFSPANMDMLTPYMTADQVQTMRIAAYLVEHLPIRSLAFAAGMTEDRPFLQIAASVAPEMRSKLDLIAKGTAKTEDVITLIGGEGMLSMSIFAPQLTPQTGSEGVYYLINDEGALAAKDDLLLLALSSDDLEDSIRALKNAKQRLNPKRRFKNPDWYYIHSDFSILEKFTEPNDEEEIESINALKHVFKAPFNMEVDFDSKPDRLLISIAANFLESLSYAERLKKQQPATGADFFLVGEGQPFLGFASSVYLHAEELKLYPELSQIWGEVTQVTTKLGITEADLENLMSGTISFAAGPKATAMGMSIPGAYAAVTGRGGAAVKILDAFMADESLTSAIPLAPLNVKGWDRLFRVDPALLPVPVLFGVRGETLFFGIIDPDTLDKKPQTPAEAKKMLNSKLFAAGFLDSKAIWEYLRHEIADETSFLRSMTPAFRNVSVYNTIKDIFDADLPVSFIKMWVPTPDTSFTEISRVSVPEENRLLPRLIKATMGDFSRDQEHEALISFFMTLKRDIEETIAANPKLSLEDLEEAYGNMATTFLETADGELYIGMPVSGDTIRLELIEQARNFGLRGSAGTDIAPDEKPYAGQEVVWVKIER